MTDEPTRARSLDAAARSLGARGALWDEIASKIRAS
jgi:hypothetical protein